jgi:hypothetical protein
MNKVLLTFVILFEISLISPNKNKFLSSNKEILIPNAISDIYGTNMQQELVIKLVTIVSLFRLQVCFQMHFQRS